MFPGTKSSVLFNSLRSGDVYIDGLVQELRNSSALAIGLHLSYTNPSICVMKWAIIDKGNGLPTV